MSEPASELLMFQLGDRTYGAAVGQVRRVDGVRAEPAAGVVVSSALGTPRARRRGIVIDCGGPERTLAVDEVHGIRAVADADLRPLPAFAAACLPRSTVAGFALLGERPTVVVDLRALVSEA